MEQAKESLVQVIESQGKGAVVYKGQRYATTNSRDDHLNVTTFEALIIGESHEEKETT